MILLIDNYDSFTYNLYQAIAKLTNEKVVVIRNDKITLDEIEALKPSAIILSPGPRRPEEAGICVDVIKRFGKSIPLLGVCLGHQAIGIAFGGKVVGAEEIVHGKDDSIHHNQKGIYANMSTPFKAGRYHSLVIERDSISDDLEITATSKNNLIMGVQHKSFPIYGVQYHPESILTPDGEKLLGNFLEIARKYHVNQPN